MQFINQFSSVLTSQQGERILKRLSIEKDAGNIVSIDDFQKRLKKLTNDLLTNEIKASFDVINPLIGEDISSEQWNYLTARLEDDLTVVFAELDNIDDILEAHESIILNVSLKVVQDIIDSLQSKIELYEFINTTDYGFDRGVFNTFRISAEQELTGNLPPDPRSLPENATVSSRGYIDEVSQYLTLGTNLSSYSIDFKHAELISDASTSWGSINNEDSRFNILNIIDNTNNTYWLKSVLAKDFDPKVIKILLKCPGAADVNYVEIEPASNLSQTLVSVTGILPNQESVELYATATSVDKKTRINFPTLALDSLIISLRQDNSSEVVLPDMDISTLLNEVATGNGFSSKDFEYELNEAVTSSLLKEDILNLSTTPSTYTHYYEFQFGIDNIYAGRSKYDSRSISAFSSVKISKPGLIGLDVNEKRNYVSSNGMLFESFSYPEQTTAEDAKIYTGSAEYWITSDFYDKNSSLITSYTFPVLPIFANRIYHETLLLNYTSSASVSFYNIGYLQFFTDNDYNDVSVYRNGYKLTPILDWDFSGLLSITDDQDGERMKRAILINSISNPLDIYTVSYTPSTANILTSPPAGHPNAKLVDLSGFGDVILTKDNTIYIKPVIKTKKVEYAEMTLFIIMRSNSSNSSYSPAVEDYLLLSASYDTNKFSDI